ncbi:tetratricopeptide (TPR) repeat protein [Crossiella equi]|uniref:Tetratricopeptide (TPR) repeat protein n=1 Tax=Crossiella equi TaxID=130796 RepID=A0ABS5A8I1_9PSEU|nr:tetratricopeptide repeat protein [Crossiella equi]MBP2472562.1 tetratricopeptide (TPR) repeat protein [Crossiella equi]
MPGGAGEHDHEHRATISGSAAEVVQAGQVHGGVHFHAGARRDQPRPRQLPGEVRGFVNRRGELDRLDEVLAGDPAEPPSAGLLVLTGTAGVGKTSLALHWAHRVRTRFPDGQLYANLCGYDPGPPVTAAQALERFLRALGVPQAALPAELDDRAALYRSLLADQRVLVLLDNAAATSQVRPLLPGTAGSLVVVTSRSRLSGLVARDGAHRVPVGTLTEADAILLLRKVTAGYRGQDEPAELAELARLCARLPLALRIAAERAASRPHLRLTELIAELRDESGLWDALTAENDEEADAVRTVFAWSYRSLSPEAARLFHLLGLCPTAEFSGAAAAALAGIPRPVASRLLDVLVGAHLVEPAHGDRYQFHDLLRAYATDQVQRVESEEERQQAVRRLCAWYLHTAAAAVGELTPYAVLPDLPEPTVTPLSFADGHAAEEWLTAERAALVAVTRLAAGRGQDDRLAWQLAATLREGYAHRNLFEDWLTTARVGLGAARRLGDRVGEAAALTSLGMACTQSRRLEEGQEHHRAALALHREAGEDFAGARSLNLLGLLALRGRDLDQARARFEEAEDAFRRLGQRRWAAIATANLAEVCYELADLTGAAGLLRRAVAVFRELDDDVGLGNALVLLAMVRRENGQTAEARSAVEGALAIAHRTGNQVWEGHWLVELARVERASGRPEVALTSCQRAVAVQHRLGDLSREAIALDQTGEVYRELGRSAEAAQFHQVAAVTQRKLGDRWRLATALHNLATALTESGTREEEAVQAWTEALSCLTVFDDPRVAVLRAAVRAGLDGQRPAP